jgi:hypothetical protein
MRSAIELLWGLQSCKDGGPPTARLLQVAMAIGDDSPALDALENIETCIDRSGKVPRLFTTKQVHAFFKEPPITVMYDTEGCTLFMAYSLRENHMKVFSEDAMPRLLMKFLLHAISIKLFTEPSF